MPVRGERHRVHRVGVAGERGAERAGRCRGSHSRTVWSRAGGGQRCPSGANATADHRAGVAGERGAERAGRWSASHSRTVWSSLAEASGCPSGANATADHRVGVAGERGADRLAGGRVPQPHRLVVAGGGQRVPVGANATPITAPVWPVSGAPIGLAGGRGPTAAPSGRRWRWPAGARRG